MQTSRTTMAKVIEPIGLLALLLRRANTITTNITTTTTTATATTSIISKTFSSYSNVTANENYTRLIEAKHHTKNYTRMMMVGLRYKSKVIFIKDENNIKSPKKLKAGIIKKMHKANKDMFGELLETSKQRNKRIKKESKILKQRFPIPVPTENLILDYGVQGLSSVTELEKVETPKSLPSQSQITLNLEQIGTTDKSFSDVRGQTKEAEINWTLKSNRKKTKVMKGPLHNSPSTSSDFNTDLPIGNDGLKGDKFVKLTQSQTKSSYEKDSGGAIPSRDDSLEGQSSFSTTAGEAVFSDAQLINSPYDMSQDILPKSELKIIKSSSGEVEDNVMKISWEAIEHLQPFEGLPSPKEWKTLNLNTDSLKHKSLRTTRVSKLLIKSQSKGDNDDILIDENEASKSKTLSSSSSSTTKVPKKVRQQMTDQKDGIFFEENGNKEENVKSTTKTCANKDLNADEANNIYNQKTSSSSVIKVPYFNPERQAVSEKEKQLDLNPNSEENENNISNQKKQIISIPYQRVFHDNYKLYRKNDNKSNQNQPTAENENKENNYDKRLSLQLPSVSKILNATMPKEQAEALERWQAKMIAEKGEEGFRLYKENMLNNGKMFHSNIESVLRGTPLEEISVAETIAGHWSSLKDTLMGVKNVRVLESHVVHPKLMYGGIVDCVAVFRGKLVVIDWKTSQKQKPFVSMTYDTPLQISAYIGAINYDPNYSLKIDEGLIVIAYEDGKKCETFLLNSSAVSKYWMKWTERLKLFYQMNPSSTT